MTKRLIGAHVSVAGGIPKSMERAHQLGANCIQIFSGSPRSWTRQTLDKIEVEKVFAEQKKYTVEKVFIHAQYLINLASPKPDLLQKSMSSLKYDLRLTSLIKASGVIVHLGSHLGLGWESVRANIAARIKEILADTPADAFLLIENSAGQNGKVNSDLAEIKWLMDRVESQRLKWCFDTCHGFAAGYELAEGVGQGRGSVIRAIEKSKLWSSLEAIHVNDSKGRFASGIDRHQNLGDGEIPTADLKFFLQFIKVRRIPLLLEVPGLDKKGPDKANIKRLKALTML